MCLRTYKQAREQNLAPRLPALHALNHNCFLPSKTRASHSTTSGQAHKKLQGAFGAGETVVNVTRLPALAAEQLMGEKTDTEGSIAPKGEGHQGGDEGRTL